VNGVYRRLKIAKQAEQIRKEPPPLPGNGPYRVIVIDPPWPYEKRDEDPSHEGVRPYHSMSVEEICAVKVASIAHEDCILWMWVTNHHMREALELLDAWGFEYKTNVVWVKDKFGLGSFIRGQHEHLLIAIKGDIPCPLPENRPPSVITARRREHSRKPDEAYEIIERMYPELPKIELFARQTRPGWEAWGNEVGTAA